MPALKPLVSSCGSKQKRSGTRWTTLTQLPLAFCFDPRDDTTGLRAGMSAYLSIDTGRQRTLAGVIEGLGQWAGDLVGRVSGAKAALVR